MESSSTKLMIFAVVVVVFAVHAAAGGRRQLLQDQQSATVNYVVVDQNGNGQFMSVQDAVDYMAGQQPAGPVTIHINAGTYTERVVIPSTLSSLTLKGEGAGVTSIEYNLKAADMGVDGMPLTAYNAATVSVFANNFIAKDIAFKNTQPPPPPGVDGFQAPAFRISGDKAAFYRCSFLGAQDTLLDDQGRHYFEGCFIQGSIDFIFGDGRSLYKNCELNSIAEGYGSVAAQDRQSSNEDTGFSFVNCNVTGQGPIYLGRAMGPYARIVFAYSYISDILDPRGWDDWDHDTSKDGTVYFGQYHCFGPGSSESQRVSWSHELSDGEAQQYLNINFINGNEWLEE